MNTEVGEGFTAKAEGGQTDVTAVFCGEVSENLTIVGVLWLTRAGEMGQ